MGEHQTALEQAVAFSDAFGCLCLVQRIAAGGKGDAAWRLHQIEVTVGECLANLRVRQGEGTPCTQDS
jgi:hypothetical protein